MSRRNKVVTAVVTSASVVFVCALFACSGGSGRAPFNPVIEIDADTEQPTVDAGSADTSVRDGGKANADAERDVQADVGPPTPFCSTALTTANASILVGVNAPFSLAESELVVAWMDGLAASPTVHIAERANLNDAFAETGTLVGVGAPFAAERPILNAQGTGLAMLNTDRRSFALFDRVVPNSLFTLSSKNTFAEVNRFLGLLANGEGAHDAVWGSGGRAVIFGISRKGIFQADATLGADDLGTPKPISNQPELLPSGDKRRRPSGVAPDNLVLFYFDEVSGQSAAATRATPFVDFTSFAQLGVIQDVQVRALCKNLYFSDRGVVKVAKQN